MKVKISIVEDFGDTYITMQTGSTNEFITIGHATPKKEKLGENTNIRALDSSEKILQAGIEQIKKMRAREVKRLEKETKQS